jgi:hypothetical protein
VFSIDLEQLQSVRRFRKSLPSRGVVYRDFQNTAEFIEQITAHLQSLVVEEWQQTAWAPIAIRDYSENIEAAADEERATPVPCTDIETRECDGALSKAGQSKGRLSSSTSAPDNDETTDLGYLDHLEEIHRALPSLTELCQQATDHANTLNHRLSASTRELESLIQEQQRVRHIGGSRQGQQNVAKLKRLVNDMASDLEDYAAAMATQMGRYRSESKALFGSMLLALESRAEFQANSEVSPDFRAAVTGLVEGIEGLRQALIRLETTMQRGPVPTGKFKRARRRVASMLGERIADLSFSIGDARLVLDRIEGAERGGEPVEGT